MANQDDEFDYFGSPRSMFETRMPHEIDEHLVNRYGRQKEEQVDVFGKRKEENQIEKSSPPLYYNPPPPQPGRHSAGGHKALAIMFWLFMFSCAVNDRICGQPGKPIGVQPFACFQK